MNGIYILANDFVYNQLVALLNSIEVNIGTEIPVCIIPYDDRLDKVRQEVNRRPQVSLFDNQGAIARWENFAARAWKAHDRAQRVWKERELPETYRLAMHRKLCCFDGEFDRFIYFDADTLALGSVDPIFEKLSEFDWVTNDYQYCSDIKYIFDAPKDHLLEIFSTEQLDSHLFCAGWFASKKEVFSQAMLDDLLVSLELGEADLMALWGPDQSLMNYMVLRSKISYYNFAFHGGAPGSHWSSKFDQVDHTLFDKGRQLTYLHYMSVSSQKFNQLCDGIDAEIPYRDLFLHYRYLRAPEERPSKFIKAKETRPFNQLVKRRISNLKHKLKQIANR
jgi:hypothetical protein